MEPKTDELICPVCGYNHNAPYLPSYLAPGTILNDRYVIGKLKSYNGESAVYLGFDSITQAKVQIKEYMPDTLCSREKGSSVINVKPSYMAQYKTLMSEFVELNKTLSKMRTLNHINAAIDMFGDNNTGYVVFNDVEGITLGEYLKKNAGELTWEEVKKLFPPIFTTLSLVHNAGLIHRGISPENIIINEKGELKLIGFCIADARTANTELAPELYIGYAAPEQYNSANWQGTWTDVYGISALLYRILTGTTPVDATSRMSNDNLLEPALINKNIPRNASKVIMNGMHLSGDIRIQTITELVTQLFEQPEYNSMRFSSSSTQTIMIPKQGYRNNASSSGSYKKKQRVSRRVVFLIVIAVTLIIGMIGLIFLLMFLDDTSSKINPGSSTSISGITENVTDELITSTTSELVKPIDVATATLSSNAIIYVMNDFSGKNYDIVKNSDTYSNLVFTPIFEYNDKVDKGLIFWQSIEKDESYENGAEITIKVSLGSKYINIPEYISLNKKEYFSILNDVGIKYEEKEFQTSDVVEGYVAKLNKQPGEMIDVEIGEILTVFIAVKPPEITTVTEKTTTEKTKQTEKTQITEPVITDEPDIIITFYD